MADYKNVVYCLVSYRRNIKDMPFVNKLNDTELAVGIARSLSEIFGDDFEFKSLKNMQLNDCKKLLEDGKITKELLSNKDISSFAINEEDGATIYASEEDHIRIECKKQGNSLEECFNKANLLDDTLLDKIEMAFDNNLGYLTADPKKCGTGMELGALLFVPALVLNGKLEKIKQEILKDEFVLTCETYSEWDKKTPLVYIKNKYTFGNKENEFATKLQGIITKLLELEKLEEQSIFDISATTLVDNIFRSYGILANSYRISEQEAKLLLCNVFWGIQLNVLKSKKKLNVMWALSKIKENHLTNGKNCSTKDTEKYRARTLRELMQDYVQKGEVDV